MHAQKRREQMANAAPLRVLCAENWLSPAVMDKFAHEHQVPIQYFTYNRPSEFLRQMANADGKVDVICSSSFLLRSLVRSHWLKKANYLELENAKSLATDFVHLPYDSAPQYGLPLFWTLYGFFGEDSEIETPFKQTLQTKKVAIWGDELNVLSLLSHSGVKMNERLDEDQPKGLEDDIKGFIRAISSLIDPAKPPADAAALMGKADWAIMPLARVAAWLDKDHHFVLPEDGGAMELGIISVGDKSAQPELALALINELIHPDHGLEIHKRLQTGVVHRTFDNVDSISVWERPQALRRFPLNRLRFPDVETETLPRFEKIYDENLKNRN